MSRVLVDSGIGYLGNIPSEWNIFRIKNAFKCKKNIVNDNWSNTQLLSLTTSGVKEKDIDNPNGKLPDSFNGYQYVEINNIIMCLFDLDCSAVFSGISKYNGMISPAYKVLECKEMMNPDYAGYYFNYIGFDRKYMHYSKNIRYTLNYDEFSSLPMIFPPLEEQKKIANYLDNQCAKINEIINDNNHEIQLLEEYKISIIENTVKNYNKDYSLRNIDWITSCDKNVELIKLKYNSIISTGTTPKDFEKNETSNKIDWFTPSDFKSIVLNNSVRKLDIDLVAENKMFPKNTTLIIGIGGTLGKVGITQDKCYSNQQITALIGNNKIIPKYLTYNLLSAQKYIKDTCPYTTLPILSNSYLKNIFICIRSKEEQEKIVEYLDNQILKIDEVIDYRKKIIEKLEEYKKSLIYECVTGKKEV